MTIANSDVESADTLQVISAGDIYPIPNPVGASTALYFSLADTVQVEVRILDMGGNLVRPLFKGELLPGYRSFTWNGDGLTGQPATQPFYWATLAAGGDGRAQLLFRWEGGNCSTVAAVKSRRSTATPTLTHRDRAREGRVYTYL